MTAQGYAVGGVFGFVLVQLGLLGVRLVHLHNFGDSLLHIPLSNLLDACWHVLGVVSLLDNLHVFPVPHKTTTIAVQLPLEEDPFNFEIVSLLLQGGGPQQEGVEENEVEGMVGD